MDTVFGQLTFANIGGDEISNELFHVAVDGATLFYGRYDGGEVVVSQNHIGGRLGYGCPTSHGYTDLSLLQSWGVVNTITRLQ